MTQAMMEMLAAMSAVTVICAGGLVGYWMTLRHRRRMAELQRGGDDLRAELDELRDEVVARLNELNERVDFAERLLIRGNAAPAERKHPTPV